MSKYVVHDNDTTVCHLQSKVYIAGSTGWRSYLQNWRMTRGHHDVGQTGSVGSHDEGSCSEKLQLRNDGRVTEKLHDVVTWKFLLESLPDLT